MADYESHIEESPIGIGELRERLMEETLLNAIHDGIREGVKKQLVSDYNSPLVPLLRAAVEAETGSIRDLLAAAIKSTVTDSDFRSEIMSAVRRQMAKQLVQKFGGELEKQVNALKSDPTTRARITLALEEIVTAPTVPADPLGFVE